MDHDTLLLIIMLGVALIWWAKLQFTESKMLAKRKEQDEREQSLRAERIKRLGNRRSGRMSG